MSFSYKVILKPSDVKFTRAKVPSKLEDSSDGFPLALETLLSDIKSGDIEVKEIGDIEVVWYTERWEWYARNNQILWVYRELEKAGNIGYVSMRRIEYINEEDQMHPIELFDSVGLEGVILQSRCSSRGSSVFSSTSDTDEERGVEQWGRKGNGPSLELIYNPPSPTREIRVDSFISPPNPAIGVKEESSVSPQDSKSCVMDWAKNRQKFCKLYSKDYNFQEYVAQNLISESATAEPSLSSSLSLLSLNTSLGSTASLSKISRSQRKIDNSSGYNGYGHFHDYNKEYLSKLRAERSAMKRKLRPYDVGSSSLSSRRSRTSSVSSRDSKSSWSVDRKVTVREERITRTYSETMNYRRQSSSHDHIRSHHRSPSREGSYNIRSDTRRFSKGRSYSEGENYTERDCGRGFVATRASAHSRRLLNQSSSSLSLSDYIGRDVRSRHSSLSSLGSYNRDEDRSSGTRLRRASSYCSRYGYRSRRNTISRSNSYCMDESRPSRTSLSRTSLSGSSSTLSSRKSKKSVFSFKISSVPKEKLYEMWQKRREAYLKARYEFSTSLVPSCGNSLAVVGYTCGLCFKSFQTRVRLEQHSEELLHWACITCGRFFASHTALGQHVEQAGHRKD